jgi:hypothetical protein
MIQLYREAFDELEITETEAFGENSYFYRKKVGLHMESGDDSEGMGVSEEDTDEDM